MQVLTRYLLQKLFGPGVAHVTSDQTILYVDLPSNMVCSLFHLQYLCVLVTYNFDGFTKANTPELFCQEHNYIMVVTCLKEQCMLNSSNLLVFKQERNFVPPS